MKNKGIAYIVAEFPSYTETFVFKEALYIRDEFSLYVFALKKGKGLTDSNPFGDRLIYVPSWSWRMLTFIPTIVKRLVFRNNIKDYMRQMKRLWVSFYIAEQLRHLPVQHLHAHFANYPTDIARLVSRSTGIPFSFTAHAHDLYAGSENLPEKIRQAAFVTTCTGYNKQWLDTLVPETERAKIHLIYHGVDLENWSYQKRVPIHKLFRILAIGRLIEKKGLIYLLEAIHQLSTQGIQLQLDIAGKGKDEKRLKRYCREHGLDSAVSFVGWQTSAQLKQLFSHSDLFVLPSVIASDGDRDGIPNVILEAMAVGLPVISTPVSGIPEVIRHQQNGLLVPEKDSDQLAHTLSTLLNNPDLQIFLSTNARKTVEQKFDGRQCSVSLKRLFDKDYVKRRYNA